MTVMDDEAGACQECGEPLTPQLADEAPEVSYDGPHGTATANLPAQDVCMNVSCPRFGKPNDPPAGS